jgi:hypothetical protein
VKARLRQNRHKDGTGQDSFLGLLPVFFRINIENFQGSGRPNWGIGTSPKVCLDCSRPYMSNTCLRPLKLSNSADNQGGGGVPDPWGRDRHSQQAKMPLPPGMSTGTHGIGPCL